MSNDSLLDMWQNATRLDLVELSGVVTSNDTRHEYERLDSPILQGKYMRVEIKQLCFNVPFKSRIGRPNRNVTLVDVLLENVSNKYETSWSVLNLIDSDGFQHRQSFDTYEFRKVICGPRKFWDANDLPMPENPLHKKAKTRGWFWFDGLENQATPYRLNLGFYVDLGDDDENYRSDLEVFEFIIKKFQVSADRTQIGLIDLPKEEERSATSLSPEAQVVMDILKREMQVLDDSEKIQVKALERVAGKATVVAVWSPDFYAPSKCLSLIPAILRDSGDEQVVFVEWYRDAKSYIASILQAEISEIELNESKGTAVVKLVQGELTNWQNRDVVAKLVYKLTGFKIKIDSNMAAQNDLPGV